MFCQHHTYVTTILICVVYTHALTLTHIHLHMSERWERKKEETNNTQPSKCNNYHHFLLFCWWFKSQRFSARNSLTSHACFYNETSKCGVVITIMFTTMAQKMYERLVRSRSQQNKNSKQNDHTVQIEWNLSKQQEYSRLFLFFLLLQSFQFKRNSA